MKIHFLGTCAGTEPMPTRKHIFGTAEANVRVKELFGGSATICEDGMTVEF